MSQILLLVPGFILFNKRGNLLVIFLNIISSFHRKLMRTCIKNLRHCSLYSYVLSKYQRFQVCNEHSKGDMHVQKTKVKNTPLFPKPRCLFLYNLYHWKGIILFYFICAQLHGYNHRMYYTMKLALHLQFTMPYHPCLFLTVTQNTHMHTKTYTHKHAHDSGWNLIWNLTLQTQIRPYPPMLYFPNPAISARKNGRFSIFFQNNTLQKV